MSTLDEVVSLTRVTPFGRFNNYTDKGTVTGPLGCLQVAFNILGPALNQYANMDENSKLPSKKGGKR